MLFATRAGAGLDRGELSRCPETVLWVSVPQQSLPAVCGLKRPFFASGLSSHHWLAKFLMAPDRE